MRQRYTAALVTFALLSITILLSRHHLRDLGEIARTYSGFHAFLQTHPDVEYRWPNPHQSPSDEGLPRQVPRILHQISLREGRNATLERYSEALASCRNLHPDWKHKMWTDENSTAFIREHYPSLSRNYDGYKQSIQRANILRYALLHHYGGAYLDLDVTCLVPLGGFLQLPWLSPGAYPAGVNNAFILSRPRHRFLGMLLDSVKDHDLPWGLPYVENMLSTGCMFFSNRWMEYSLKYAKTPNRLPMEDRLYVLADQNGNLDPHMLRGTTTTPLFKHGGASSWHGWDAEAIVVIGKHYDYFIILLIGGILVAFVSIWRWTRPRRAGYRDRSLSWAVRSRLDERREVELGRPSLDHRRVRGLHTV